MNSAEKRSLELEADRFLANILSKKPELEFTPDGFDIKQVWRNIFILKAKETVEKPEFLLTKKLLESNIAMNSIVYQEWAKAIPHDSKQAVGFAQIFILFWSEWKRL